MNRLVPKRLAAKRLEVKHRVKTDRRGARCGSSVETLVLAALHFVSVDGFVISSMALGNTENVLSTFHCRVYGNKKVRKESDLPEDLTNASAATRRVFDPAVKAPKQATKDKRSGSRVKSLACAGPVHYVQRSSNCVVSQQTRQEGCAQAYQQQWG